MTKGNETPHGICLIVADGARRGKQALRTLFGEKEPYRQRSGRIPFMRSIQPEEGVWAEAASSAGFSIAG